MLDHVKIHRDYLFRPNKYIPLAVPHARSQNLDLVVVPSRVLCYAKVLGAGHLRDSFKLTSTNGNKATEPSFGSTQNLF